MALVRDEFMTLPEPLRQQLGRLKEQGCPAALVERAMGIGVVGLHSGGAVYSGGCLVLSLVTCDPMLGMNYPLVTFYEDGLVAISGRLSITIPAPKGAA